MEIEENYEISRKQVADFQTNAYILLREVMKIIYFAEGARIPEMVN